MNFEKMIDGILAEKIKNARKSMKMTQEQFCEEFELKVSIDKFRLSSLENGKRNKKKNPHFLTESYIEFFSELLNISPEEF
ncbi:TPA: helix-turn-helix domain-containing protein, partial [Streptococcus pyogenes]|nr:helix-turn-helix transcriptional regulator [Streptococcus pyogenes]